MKSKRYGVSKPEMTSDNRSAVKTQPKRRKVKAVAMQRNGKRSVAGKTEEDKIQKRNGLRISG